MAKNNLKAATKKSIQEAKVQQLDNFGTDVNEFLQTESLSLVEDIVGDFILRVQDNINNEEGMVTTGKISDISIEANGGTINVMGYPWLIYQDRGVNGAVKKLYNTPHAYTDKKPPVQVFKDLIKAKNIRLINNHKMKGKDSPFKELTEEQQINNAAWAFVNKVYKEGFKPRNIYSKEIPQLIDDLTKQIADFTVQSIVQAIDVKPSAKRIILPKK